MSKNISKKGKNMTILEEKEALKKELLKAKSEGLRVFINKSPDYAYGLMTDGISMIYVDITNYPYGFTTSLEYVPNKATGSGCHTLDHGYYYKELNKGIFLEAVNAGKKRAFVYGAECYKSFEHYLKRHPDFYRFYREL